MQLAFERVQQHPAIRALSAAENCARLRVSGHRLLPRCDVERFLQSTGLAEWSARLSSQALPPQASQRNSSVFWQVVPSILCRSNAAATSRPSVSNIDHYDELVLGTGKAGEIHCLDAKGSRCCLPPSSLSRATD